jgi:MFS family permease
MLQFPDRKMKMDNLARLARRITFILFVEQSLASAGFIAAATLNSIVGAQLSRHSGWAGVPAAVHLLAGALSAFAWGYLMDVIGRRGGLVLGLCLGVLGSGLAFYAIVQSSFVLFLLGMILMGVANAAVQLGRFAAAEVNPPQARGRAISNVVIGGTFGSIFGPILVGPAGEMGPGFCWR